MLDEVEGVVSRDQTSVDSFKDVLTHEELPSCRRTGTRPTCTVYDSKNVSLLGIVYTGTLLPPHLRHTRTHKVGGSLLLPIVTLD